MTRPTLSPNLGRVARWLIYLMGFRQHEGALTGLEVLYYEARRRYGRWPTEVRLYSYNDNLDAIADAIAKQSTPHAQIILTGYSLGGGSAARLARMLATRDRKVSRLYLCDAVARQRNPLGWWRCYFGRGLLQVPPNVERVWSCRQHYDFPRGSKIILENRETVHREAFVSPIVSHLWMDETRKFHNEHLAGLAELMQNPIPELN